MSGASIARGCPRTIGQKPEPTIRRGTARKSLPPRGRGTAIAVEGARVTLQFARILLSRALPQSFATQKTAPSRREPFISSLRQKNTTKEIFLVVFVFSPLKMHSRAVSFLLAGMVKGKSAISKVRSIIHRESASAMVSAQKYRIR